MSWIEQTLRQIARERRRQMQPQPPGPVGFGEALGGGAPAPMGLGAALGGGAPRPQGFGAGLGAGGAAANEAREDFEGRDVSMGPERATALMNAYQTYLKRSGRKQDPLLDGRGRTQVDEQRDGTVRMASAGAKVLERDGEPFFVNKTNNERRGLTAQTFELPGGQRVNVYYGKNGERTVVRLPRKR